MANESVSFLELVGGMVVYTSSAVFGVWKLVNNRFRRLEQTIDDHVKVDIDVHARHGEQIERFDGLVSPQVRKNTEDIVRLQTEHTEKLRRLDEMKVAIDRLHEKTDTVMETLASLLFKMGANRKEP